MFNILTSLHQAWKRREILEGAPKRCMRKFLGATLFNLFPHHSKSIKFAHVSFKILSRPKDCDEDGLEKRVVYFGDYDN